MEYVFGTDHKKETLRTKGSEHTNLTGFHEIVREYPDQTITDRFCIVRKTNSKEDDEGNCYDWYEICNHYRYTDKTRPIQEALDEAKMELEDALCEIDEANEERIAAIEDALCEMDMGGND